MNNTQIFPSDSPIFWLICKENAHLPRFEDFKQNIIELADTLGAFSQYI